jgi:hypothetical protein
MTTSAGHGVGYDRHAVTNIHVVHVSANPDYLSCTFVSHNHGRTAAIFAIINVKVGATDASRLDRDLDLGGSGNWFWHIAQLNIARTRRKLDQTSHVDVFLFKL